MDWRPSSVPGGWLGLGLLVLLLAACGTAAPASEARGAPITCQPDPSKPPSALSCDAALAAASAALPLFGPPIGRIEFRYGYPCIASSPALKCVIKQPAGVGYVLVTYADASVAMVPVRADRDGRVTARPAQEWPAEEG